MKTVQEYLRQADRERLLDALAYDDLCDVHLLLECRDMTIDQIQDACKKRMNSLIEHLLTLDAEPSDHMVLYMVDASSFDRRFYNEYRSLNMMDNSWRRCAGDILGAEEGICEEGTALCYSGCNCPWNGRSVMDYAEWENFLKNDQEA